MIRATPVRWFARLLSGKDFPFSLRRCNRQSEGQHWPFMKEPVADRPASIGAVREAFVKGREPPPARMFARLASYRWLVVGTVCIGALMGQVDSSITQLLLPRLELEFNAKLSTVSWVAVAYLLAMAAFLPIFGRLADLMVQVNTGGDPTSTLLQNCATDSSKFFLLTSASQIVTTFNQIGTVLSQLRVAK